MPVGGGGVQSVGAILNYLVQADGWAPWTEVVAHFQIADDFGALQRSLASLQSHDRSFTGKHPEWIRSVSYGSRNSNTGRPDEVNCFMFSRLCVSHQRTGICDRGSSCDLLHLCRQFVLGVTCEAGEKCPRGHKVIGRVAGVVNTWTNKQRLQFVRHCHPQVCEKYNAPDGCKFGEKCDFLHVCNDFIIGAPHSRGCILEHNLSSAQCRRVLMHFMFSDLPFEETRWLIIPVIPMNKKAASKTKSKAAKSAANASSSATATGDSERLRNVPSLAASAGMYLSSGIAPLLPQSVDSDPDEDWITSNRHYLNSNGGASRTGLTTSSKFAHEAYGSVSPPPPPSLLTLSRERVRRPEVRESSAPATTVSPYCAQYSSARGPAASPSPAQVPNKPQTQAPPSPSPSASSSASLSLSPSKSVGAIVSHIAKHGGWLPWLKLARDLGVGADFGELHKWLLAQRTRDLSFTGAHSDWIRPVLYSLDSDSGAGKQKTKNTSTSTISTPATPDEVNIFLFGRICMNHQRDKCSFGASCSQVHICRDYLLRKSCAAGESCARGHRVKWRLGAPDTWSNERMLQFVIECHPQVCISYNSPTGCSLAAGCFNAHLCNDWLLARCRRLPCRLSHDLHNAQVRRVYAHFSLDYKVMSDADLRILVLPQPGLDAGIELLPSPTSLQPPARNGIPSLLRVVTPATASTNGVPSSATIPKYSGVSKVTLSAAAVSKSAANNKHHAYPNDDPGLIVRASLNNVLQHLLKLGGWNRWPNMVHEMRLPSSSFAALQEFLSRRASGSSFVSRHLHFIQPVYMNGSESVSGCEPDTVNMFRFVRLCWQWQAGTCAKSAEKCEHLHICRNYIAGLCTAGAACPLGHSFERSWLSELPFSTSWSTARIAEFVRDCHPAPCLAYNSDEGCSVADCHALHVCALFPYGQCRDPKCPRSHDLRSKHCTDVFKFFSVSNSAAFQEQIDGGILSFLMPTALLAGNTDSSKRASRSTPLFQSLMVTVPSGGASKDWSPKSVETATTTGPGNITAQFRPQKKCPSIFSLLGPSARSHVIVNNVLQRLLPRGGFEAWASFCVFFGLPPSLPFDSLTAHLAEITRNSTSYVAQHLNFFTPVYMKNKPEAGVPDAITMFRFVRLCFQWQTGACKKSADKCDYLHLCRNYIAGLCTAGADCPLGHSFERTCVPELLGTYINSWSIVRIAEFIRGCHPSPCPGYNSDAGCTDPDCNSLHLCALFPYGQCTDASKCRLSHDFLSKQCRDVFKFFALDPSICNKSNGILKYIMPLTSEIYQPQSEYIPPTSNSAFGLEPAVTVTVKSSFLEDVSGHRVVDAYESFTPVCVDPSPTQLSTKKCALSSIAALLGASAKNRVSPNNILQRLIPREGFERWDTFCASFGLPKELAFEALASHLLELSNGSDSYNAQHPHFFEPIFLNKQTGVPSAISMFRFVRLCFRWQEGDGKCAKGDECDCLHVCRDWIAGICEKGNRCARVHDIIKTWRPLAQIPFHHMKTVQIQRFIRLCHPRVCELYNTSAGCPNKSHCARLHLCNSFLRGCCTQPAVCNRSHDMRSAQCRSVYARFNLVDLANNSNFRSLHWLLMPLAGGPPLGTEIDGNGNPKSKSKGDKTLSFTFSAGANSAPAEADADYPFSSYAEDGAAAAEPQDWSALLSQLNPPPLFDDLEYASQSQSQSQSQALDLPEWQTMNIPIPQASRSASSSVPPDSNVPLLLPTRNSETRRTSELSTSSSSNHLGDDSAQPAFTTNPYLNVLQRHLSEPPADSKLKQKQTPEGPVANRSTDDEQVCPSIELGGDQEDELIGEARFRGEFSPPAGPICELLQHPAHTPASESSALSASAATSATAAALVGQVNYLWQFRIPPSLVQNDSGLQYSAPSADDCWLPFADNEAAAIEKAFCDPMQSVAQLYVDFDSTYPFAGTALVLLDTFGLESQSAAAAAAAASGTAVGVPAFGMRVRLKRRIDSDAARAKNSDSPSTASQQQTTTSRSRFECTRIEEIEVRRAPSNAVSCSTTANAASGTRWIWWLRNSGKRLLQESTSHWIDATIILGTEQVVALESAFLAGNCSYSMALPSLGSLSFDFESMLLSDGENFFEMRLRPSMFP